MSVCVTFEHGSEFKRRIRFSICVKIMEQGSLADLDMNQRLRAREAVHGFAYQCAYLHGAGGGDRTHMDVMSTAF